MLKQDESPQKKSDYDTNRIMGIAAIFISVLSAMAVIYQSYLAREENKLMRIQQSATVLPYLDFWYSNIGDEYKFVFENKGIGPAFIKDVKFIGIDSNQEDTLTFNNIHKFSNFIEEQSPFIDSISVIKSSFNANMLLSPSEKKEFLVFSFKDKDQKRRFGKEFSKYSGGFKIVYEDVYGAKWKFHSDIGFPVKIE